MKHLELFTSQIQSWLEEDDLLRNLYYQQNLPQHSVQGVIKLKSPLVLAGLPFFASVFETLGVDSKIFQSLMIHEGKRFEAGESLELSGSMSFKDAVNGERLALNLLAHASSIATFTSQFVDKAKNYNINILDTRKTTPGLRSLEKYAVRVGGGFNHRFGQTDAWMIKDNHKTSMGGLKGAWEFFKAQGAFYNSVVVEIHSLEELKEAKQLGIKNIMLDNFSPENIKKAIELKEAGMTYEVSGGVRLETLDNYLIKGIDAISVGALTNAAPRVDISFKFHQI
jgi:nicotinate-nucleotide pyrophosphorylase (carboxylating)